jgi:mannose-6-phosphate isomerase
MAIELACTNVLRRPWGVLDLMPWNRAPSDGLSAGEVWYERPGKPASAPSLLLKLLFTSQPLSIQVHPDDVHAQAMGLPNGKTEAWYVLSAAPGAKIALGLKQQVTTQQLRSAVHDGSIADLVVWRAVAVDDVISVPAGTIHAIGAGLVIAEVQQRSEATFRLFDYGRRRELHVERAIAVANTGRADIQLRPSRLTDERTLLVCNPHFVFERIELPPGSIWSLQAERETWLLALKGDARTGPSNIGKGDAIFAHSERVDVDAGKVGLTGLVAYAAHSPLPNFLQRRTQLDATDAGQPKDVQVPPSLRQATAESANGRMERTQ